MKKTLNIVLGLLLVSSIVYSAGGYNNFFNLDQFNKRAFITSIGSLDIQSGGELDIESGASLKLAGTTVDASAAELNIMSGVTATSGEINILAGATVNTTEINFLDGSSAGVAVASKALVLDSNKRVDDLDVSGCYEVDGNKEICSVDVTISTAEILNLNNVAIQIVAAPGANLALVPLQVTGFLNFNAAAYDNVAAGEDFSIKYTSSAGVEWDQIETTGFIDQANSELRHLLVNAAAVTPAVNAALVLHLLVGEVATGDSELKLRVFYKVIPSTL